MPAEALRADAMLARKLLAEQRFAVPAGGCEVNPAKREPAVDRSRTGPEQRWNADRAGGGEFREPRSFRFERLPTYRGSSLTKRSPSSPDQRTHSAMLPPATCAAGAGFNEQPSASARPGAASRSHPQRGTAAPLHAAMRAAMRFACSRSMRPNPWASQKPIDTPKIRCTALEIRKLLVHRHVAHDAREPSRQVRRLAVLAQASARRNSRLGT
jgi:hypothetical protein